MNKFAKSTTKPQPLGYLVNATVKDGKYSIKIQPLHCGAEHQQGIKNWVEKLNKKENKEEWYTTLHSNLIELKSVLMVVYGIGWFNRARVQIKDLEA